MPVRYEYLSNVMTSVELEWLTGIVHQNVQYVALLQELSCSSSDGFERVELNFKKLKFASPFTCSKDLFQNFLSPFHVSDLHEYMSSCCMEGPYCLKAKSRRSTSYKHDFVGHLVHQPFILNDLHGCRACITLTLRVFMSCSIGIGWGRHLGPIGSFDRLMVLLEMSVDAELLLSLREPIYSIGTRSKIDTSDRNA